MGLFDLHIVKVNTQSTHTHTDKRIITCRYGAMTKHPKYVTPGNARHDALFTMRCITLQVKWLYKWSNERSQYKSLVYHEHLNSMQPIVYIVSRNFDAFIAHCILRYTRRPFSLQIDPITKNNRLSSMNRGPCVSIEQARSVLTMGHILRCVVNVIHINHTNNNSGKALQHTHTIECARAILLLAYNCVLLVFVVS